MNLRLEAVNPDTGAVTVLATANLGVVTLPRLWQVILSVPSGTEHDAAGFCSCGPDTEPDCRQCEATYQVIVAQDRGMRSSDRTCFGE